MKICYTKLRIHCLIYGKFVKKKCEKAAFLGPKDSENEKVRTYWSYGGQFSNKCLLFSPPYMTHLTSDFNSFKVKRIRNQQTKM